MIKMPHTQIIRTGLAAGMAVILAMAAGCSPSVAPAPAAQAKMTVVAAAGKSNTVSRMQGTNIALLETNSVFDDKIKNARDPFFPASTRLEPKSATAAAAAPAAVHKAPAELVLVLNGIMGKAGQRIALINGRTFETGDEVVIRTTNGQTRVKCLEIEPQSVTVTVNGNPEARKLFLKK